VLVFWKVCASGQISTLIQTLIQIPVESAGCCRRL
jgi:hypothetical protein